VSKKKQEELEAKWEAMSPEERKAAAREQFVGFLEMFQRSEPIMYINGKAQDHAPMSKEEADLHLAIFDGDVDATPEVRLELAQFEAARWPGNKKLQAKMWRAMQEVEDQTGASSGVDITLK
tara:strand:- start:119 stop:484 length:366 start_codon:yes stop_codon:yes gene_type:complete